MARQFIIVCFSITFFILGGIQTNNAAIAQENAIAASIKTALMSATATAKGPRARLKAIRDWYERNNHNPVWLKYGVPSAKAKALIDVLLAAREEALAPSDYNAEALSKLLDDGSAAG